MALNAKIEFALVIFIKRSPDFSTSLCGIADNAPSIEPLSPIAPAIKFFERGDAISALTEIEPAAADFMGETCRVWERAADLFENNSKRVVKIRTGVVLAKEGGALPKMMVPFKYHLGAALGSGKQQIPWIHLEDICKVFMEALENESYTGPINAVATEECTNKAFSRTLATVLGKSLLPLPVPSFVIKLIFGEMSTVVLEGSRISNAKLKNLGFKFSFEELGGAIRDLK